MTVSSVCTNSSTVYRSVPLSTSEGGSGKELPMS